MHSAQAIHSVGPSSKEMQMHSATKHQMKNQSRSFNALIIVAAEVLEYAESRDFHPIVPSVLMIKTEGRGR